MFCFVLFLPEPSLLLFLKKIEKEKKSEKQCCEKNPNSIALPSVNIWSHSLEFDFDQSIYSIVNVCQFLEFISTNCLFTKL